MTSTDVQLLTNRAWALLRPWTNNPNSTPAPAELTICVENIHGELQQWRSENRLAQLRGRPPEHLTREWMNLHRKTLRPTFEAASSAALLLITTLCLEDDPTPISGAQITPSPHVTDLAAALLALSPPASGWGELQAIWAASEGQAPGWCAPRTDLDPTPQLRECLNLLKLLPPEQSARARDRWAACWKAGDQWSAVTPGQITAQSWSQALKGTGLTWEKAGHLNPMPGHAPVSWRRELSHHPGSHRLPRPEWLPELPAPPILNPWTPHLGMNRAPQLNREDHTAARAYVCALEDAAESIHLASERERMVKAGDQAWFDIQRSLINQLSVTGPEAPLRWALGSLMEPEWKEEEIWFSLPTMEQITRMLGESLRGWILTQIHIEDRHGGPSPRRLSDEIRQWTVGGYGRRSVGHALHIPSSEGDYDYETEHRDTKSFRLDTRAHNPHLTGFWGYLMAAGMAGQITRAADTLTDQTLEVARTRLRCQLIAGDIHDLISETVFRKNYPAPLNWSLLRTCDVQALLKAGSPEPTPEEHNPRDPQQENPSLD